MSPQAGWILQEEICPRIAAVVPRSIICVGVEDHAELVQDGITMAARMVDRLEQQSKLNNGAGASNVAYYTLQHLKSGRRAAGSSCVDVHGSMTQLNGCVDNHSLSEVVNQNDAGEEIFELHDVVASDTEDPATIAARNIDWQAFAGSLTKLEKLLIECLLSGQSLTDAAKRARVHYSTMINYRQKLAVKLLDFMGSDILRDIACTPHWRIGLDCERQILACRADRRN
jgi:hypothetical protein